MSQCPSPASFYYSFCYMGSFENVTEGEFVMLQAVPTLYSLN